MSAADGGYVALLRLRGAAAMLTCATVARLVFGALPLALLLFVDQQRSSYAEASAVLGAYGLTAGLLGPARAAVVDRAGVARGVTGCAVAWAAGLVALLASVRGPIVVPAGVALLAGCCSPPVGPVVRSAWRRLADDEPARVQRAYALDAVTEEAAFVLGPVLATLLLARAGGLTAVTTCVVALLVAAPCLAWQASTPRTTGSASAVSRGGALWRDPPFLRGLAPVAALGFALAAVEVAGVAAALATAGEGVAGIPSAAVAAGSLVGGLVYGHRRWAGTARTHSVVLTLGTAALVAVAGLAAGVFALMVGVLALAGLAISPAIVASYLVADEWAAAGDTRPTTWVNTAFNTALAAGTVTAGVVVSAGSPTVALCASAAGAALLALAGGRAGVTGPGAAAGGRRRTAPAGPS